MNATKSLIMVAMLGLALPAGTAFAQTATDKPAASDAGKSDDKKFTKAQIEAFLSKCSDEADAKGLTVKAGKKAARKEFRRDCMRKFGVSPKAD